MLVPYKPEAYLNFADPALREKMLAAIKSVEGTLGREYPLLINGKRVMPGKTFASLNPSAHREIVGRVAKAGKKEAEQAIAAADAAFEQWRKTCPKMRAEYLFKAAAILRRRKLEFAAYQVLEVGKSWPEADGDVAEAIDFLEFYGRQMIDLAKPREITRIPGEDNDAFYIPLGVGVVIPPWNFPLAILVGMVTSALVAGNTVVLKPASPSAVIGAKFVEVLEEMDLPPGVVNFVPGSGAEIGDLLVDHPRTRFISFTGSKETGLRIFERASRVSSGQIWLKRVVAEMGGKDAIFVDDKVFDLDEVASETIKGAFGFQGQKCSACSRIIVHKKVYRDLVKRIVERAEKIKVGDVRDPGNYMGPVVDKSAFDKITSYIEIGKTEGKLAVGGTYDDKVGYFVSPTVFVDVPPTARIAREEIFGPVLTVIKVDSFEEGMKVVNSTEYGLTGAFFSVHRDHIQIAKRDFHVGNLYINRRCTGALVGVHPFGGFNMSGTDSKAGGFDYLMQFTQQKVVSEYL
ncbi:MAG: L-glutamate gamma-semialdehyde dehydrogenase [Candidatus Brocadiia bacterium]